MINEEEKSNTEEEEKKIPRFHQNLTKNTKNT
jgi:hypothetical protein